MDTPRRSVRARSQPQRAGPARAGEPRPAGSSRSSRSRRGPARPSRARRRAALPPLPFESDRQSVAHRPDATNAIQSFEGSRSSLRERGPWLRVRRLRQRITPHHERAIGMEMGEEGLLLVADLAPPTPTPSPSRATHRCPVAMRTRSTSRRRVGERPRIAEPPSDLDRLTCQRLLVAQGPDDHARPRRDARAASRATRCLRGRAASASSSSGISRWSFRRGTRSTCRRSRERRAQAAPALSVFGEVGGTDEGLLGGWQVPAPRLRVAEGEQQLAALLIGRRS